MDGEKLRLLGDSIARTVAAIDRTEHQLMVLLREFDEADGWQLDGQTSLVAWLSYRTGMSPGAARERVRVATALAGLPLIDAAFGSSEISYSKARAATRVATAENEAVLLTSARGMSASELEKLCAMVGSVGCDTEAAEPERRFSQRAVGDGMIRMTLTVPADEAAVVCAALDSFASAPNRRAEGLVAMADECSRGNAANRTPTEVALRIEADDLSGITGDGAGDSRGNVATSSVRRGRGANALRSNRQDPRRRSQDANHSNRHPPRAGPP